MCLRLTFICKHLHESHALHLSRRNSVDWYAGIRNDPVLPRDVNWLPFGTPATNTSMASRAVNPAFPAYPSGHATIGTAAFTVAQAELSDIINSGFVYDFTSAEFDGVARNPDGTVRDMVTRRLTIDDAIEQNKVARVFIGVHWRFDAEQGGDLGEMIGRGVQAAFPARA